jgi:hypothetical protein
MLDPYRWDINGISQRPMPVELGFGVGPVAIEIDRTTAKDVGSHTTYRASIPNRNTKPVDTNVFLDPAFGIVSAILGISIRDDAFAKRLYPSAVAYNPSAQTRVPSLWLPGQEHWVGRPGRPLAVPAPSPASAAQQRLATASVSARTKGVTLCKCPKFCNATHLDRKPLAWLWFVYLQKLLRK